MYDYIIIGAGYAGMAIAALLARAGLRILLLEQHNLPGGCASYFRRKEFLFDVGATTFSGVLPEQPIGHLLSQLEIQPALQKIDPGMVILLDEHTITRYANPDHWLAQAKAVFGKNGQEEFWQKIYQLEPIAWQLNHQNHRLPPKSLADWLSGLKWSNRSAVSILPYLFTSVEKILRSLNFTHPSLFTRFLEEQLRITTQSGIETAPFLTAAMGLAYPSQTYYPIGGMYKIGDIILQRCVEAGGQILYKQQVVGIENTQESYLVRTKSGESFASRGIISNLTIQSMAEITKGKMQNYFRKLSRPYPPEFGAFTIYFGIDMRGISLSSLYYQVHMANIPHCNAQAIFISFSAENDRDRAPVGYRAVTISTHTACREWLALSKEQYREKKQQVVDSIIHVFRQKFGLSSTKKLLFLQSGTPASFLHYTGRKDGFSGGIPHTIHKNLLRMPGTATPFANFYLVGDTIFPGQGVAAVIQSALNTYWRICR